MSDGYLQCRRRERADVFYQWRYLDAGGHDVTERMCEPDFCVVVVVAEAVQVTSGLVLLTVHRDEAGGGWVRAGGWLGPAEEAFGSPYDAMAAAALDAGLFAREQ